jgi:hypothetical protein
MLKDMRIALGIAESAGTGSRLSAAAVELRAEAAADLPGDADHTEIARWLDPERFRFLNLCRPNKSSAAERIPLVFLVWKL